MLLLEAIEQLKTVQLAASQPNVEENEFRLVCNDSGQRFVAIARRTRAVPFVLQNARDRFLCFPGRAGRFGSWRTTIGM